MPGAPRRSARPKAASQISPARQGRQFTGGGIKTRDEDAKKSVSWRSGRFLIVSVIGSVCIAVCVCRSDDSARLYSEARHNLRIPPARHHAGIRLLIDSIYRSGGPTRRKRAEGGIKLAPRIDPTCPSQDFSSGKRNAPPAGTFECGPGRNRRPSIYVTDHRIRSRRADPLLDLDRSIYRPKSMSFRFRAASRGRSID